MATTFRALDDVETLEKLVLTNDRAKVINEFNPTGEKPGFISRLIGKDYTYSGTFFFTYFARRLCDVEHDVSFPSCELDF